MAMPSSGHQPSGMAMNVPSAAYSDGLNSGVGSRALTSRSLRSASAVDLIPSATSASAARNRADPDFWPPASSVARSRYRAAAALHRVGDERPDVPEAGHLAGGIGDSARQAAYRTGPTCQIRSGILVVRCSRTNPASRRFLSAGTRTSMRSGTALPMW